MLDTRVESALPILAKLELEGKSMEEVQQFEKWEKIKLEMSDEPLS